MNVSLIGPSGSGKGTHLARVEREFGLKRLSSGDLFREHLEKKTALGLLAKKYLVQGELVPDEVTDAMMESSLGAMDTSQGIVFDGFPRTADQAKFLDELFSRRPRQFDAAIYLDIRPETVARRLAGRLVCRLCQAPYHAEYCPPAQAGICDRCGGPLEHRADDNAELTAVRLRAFQRVSGPLLEYYEKSGRLAVVDGEAAPAVVYENIRRILEAVAQHGPLAPAPVAAAQIHLMKMLPVARRGVGTGIVLVGGPGSGKGTQAEQLCQQLHLPHIASGDLFRDNLKRQTPLGQLAKTYMDRGELVPDDITEAMVEERLGRADTAGGFILDGFPRTLPQAQALGAMLDHLGRRLAGVIYIKVSDEEIVHRLSGRLICRNCQAPYHLQFKPPAKPGVCDLCGGPLYQRDDDNPETVRARLKTFHSQTGPLIEYYQKAGLVMEVAGEGAVAQVTARTLQAAQKFAA